jgi:hypothetical protein
VLLIVDSHRRRPVKYDHQDVAVLVDVYGRAGACAPRNERGVELFRGDPACCAGAPFSTGHVDLVAIGDPRVVVPSVIEKPFD